MSRALSDDSILKQSCTHLQVEGLGSDGFVEFYRCDRCHDVIVVQGTRRWVVASVPLEA
jgi:hypothetical protein